MILVIMLDKEGDGGGVKYLVGSIMRMNENLH